jgi:outer membrane protein assembly factor BamB
MKRTRFGCGALALTVILGAPSAGTAQLAGVENGEWRYLGGDAGHTRSSALKQIDASNFSKLKVAWIFRGDNFGPGIEYTSRSTPLFVDGVLYTVVGQRRQVVAIDAATGETRWTFREPDTSRYWRSPRSDFGKGVAYANVDGRGVIYISTPGFFLWALDARTGRPLEKWGTASVPLKDFPRNGVIDMIPDLVRDWEPWLKWKGAPYDPDYGLPRALGEITCSSPPIVVNGVVVVLAGHEPSYDQTRIENVPAYIQGYDAKTGKHLWKFHVIPRPGEVGHETWKNDAWKWSGNIASWAPASADPARGLVYIVTNASTYQFYTGHRPGDNLFGGSVIALDVKTGKRKWHFQVHHSEQWNYDIPTAPILMDLTVNGRKIPALIQNTKQGLIFALNRETGEPIWPIEERPVMQTEVPGNFTSPTQPYPTRPEPLDPIVLNGITEEFVLDYTPELKRRATEILSKFRVGGLYVPPLPYPHKNSFLNNVGCVGGLNIYHPPVADPTTGILYASHQRGCSAPSFLVPTEGKDEERTEFAGKSEEAWRGRDRVTPTTGTTAAHRRAAGLQAALHGTRRLRHEHGRQALGPSRWPDSGADQEPPASQGRRRPGNRRNGPFHPNGRGRPPGADDRGPEGRDRSERERQAAAACPRQEDREDPRQRGAADSRSVRDDDLHARRQAVHRGAGGERAPRAAGRSRGACAAVTDFIPRD